MSDRQSKIVIEAHALRSATATAVLLHGSRRGPRELRKPFGTLIASVILAAALLVAVAAASKISDALDKRQQQQQRRPGSLPATVETGVTGQLAGLEREMLHIA